MNKEEKRIAEIDKFIKIMREELITNDDKGRLLYAVQVKFYEHQGFAYYEIENRIGSGI